MSGDKTQTTNSSSEPWSAAQPALGSSLQGAQDLYSRGIGGQVYRGSTVVPFANDTTSAQNMERSAATGSQGAFDKLWGNTVAETSDGGLNTTQQGALAQLMPIASGKMMDNNPYLEGIIAKNARDMGDAISLSASGAGRYGSGAHQDLLARNIGDMAGGLRYQNYGDEAARRDSAIRDVFGMGQQKKTNQGGYADTLSGAYQARMNPAQTMYGLGGQFEDLKGRQINDQLRIFQAEQDNPWTQLGRLNAIATGAGSMGGTQQSVAQVPGKGFGDFAGNALSLLSLL